MNKEEILLNNFTLLSKDPVKNDKALRSLMEQLIKINPELCIKCWKECIKSNIGKLEPDFGKTRFDYDSVGYVIIWLLEEDLLTENSFVDAIDIFCKDRYLLEILYTKSPVGEIYGPSMVVSYLIRNKRFKEADAILSAIYKNKTFSGYSDLWESIIRAFEYGEEYSPNVYFAESKKQPEEIQEFCFSWIDRITDEIEKAKAITFALEMV